MLAKNILNKSEIAGTNWLNPLALIPIVIGIIYTITNINKYNQLQLLGTFGIILFLYIAIIITIKSRISLALIKRSLAKQNKQIQQYIFGSFNFTNQKTIEDITFDDSLNSRFIDIIAVITTELDCCIKPTIDYTRQPLIVIRAQEIRKISTSETKIKRLTVSDNSSRVLANNSITPLLLNQINSVTDTVLPISKIILNIETEQTVFQFLLKNDNRSINFINLLQSNSKK